MNKILALLSSLLLASCFPAYQAGVPNVNVSVVDQDTGSPITKGKIRYASVPQYNLPSADKSDDVQYTTINIEGATTQIEGWGAFGIFWLMQSPLPSTMKLEVQVPNYVPYHSTISTTTHGAFGPFNIEETAKLKPSQP